MTDSPEEFRKRELEYLRLKNPGVPDNMLEEKIGSLHTMFLHHQTPDFDKWLEKGNKKKKEKEEKAKEIQYVSTSCFEFQGKIYEEVFDGERTHLCSYDRLTGDIDYVDEVVVEPKKFYQPINDEEVFKGFIMLPSKPEEYGTEEELDANIRKFINKWLDIPSDDVEIGILTTKKSWIYQRFNTLNYLRVLGDFGAGKSRYLDVFAAIHYKALKTTGTVTPAALFRVIGKWGGTIAIDEADRAKGDETDDVLKIINQGYEEGNPVLRCDPNDQSKVEFHNVFCPKILSSRKPFEDKATESRCFTTVLHSTTRKDIPPNRNDDFKKESLSIRNKLLMWRFRNYYTINAEAGATIDLGISDPRLRQISNGFVALFLNNEERLDMFRKLLQEREKDLIDERSSSWEGRIVKAIVELLLSGVEKISATEIVYKADLKDRDTQDLVKPRAIVKYMKSLGFGKTILAREGNNVFKYYDFDKEYLLMIAPRYISDGLLVEKLRNYVTVVTASMQDSEKVTNSDISKNDALITSGYIGYTVTITEEEKWLKCINFMEKNPVGNAWMIDEVIGIDIVNKWKNEGRIYENPAGTYRKV